jgi:hypothetical protein
MRIDGLWRFEDRLDKQLRPVPFEVPPRTAEIAVALDYDRGGGAVLDLGLAGPEGFRGWSGSARPAFAVGPERATPGYLPGPITPGVWHVWLGLHRVPPEGVRYSLEIRTGERAERTAADAPPGARGAGAGLVRTAEQRPERRPPRDLPGLDGRRWFAGDLHTHTEHSDGALTVDELADLAYDAGLDFVAVTDHNTVSHHALLPAASERSGVLLIPGQEVTAELGHANVWGAGAWIDFRKPVAKWMQNAAKQGGLFCVNHPLAGDSAWRYPLTTQPSIAEVWHWTWRDRTWGEPLAWVRRHPAAVVPVGGSDFHAPGGTPAALGSPVTWVLAEECGVRAVLAGIERGATAVSAGLDGPLVLRLGDEIVADGADGLVLVRPDETRVLVRGDRRTFPAGLSGMYRLETWRNEVVALCG